MGIIELILISISLSMDSLAVSICKGLSMKKFDIKKGTIIGLYFSIFHVFMIIFGYTLGSAFDTFINNIDHWIAFILLLIIGINMIKEGILEDDDNSNDKIDAKTMLPLSLATSIDALALGITFSFLKVNILLAILLIGIIVFIASIIGTKIGNSFGRKYEKKAQIFGGIILILIGSKILLEHLGIL